MRRSLIWLSALVLLLGSCVPNFRPEDSSLGPMVVRADYSAILPKELQTDKYKLRVSMYCYESTKDSLVGKTAVYPSPQENDAVLFVPILERDEQYTVVIVADFLERRSEEYSMQLWYHVRTNFLTDFYMERVSSTPSEADAIGYLSTRLFPGEEEVPLSLQSPGKPGRVIVDNYDKTTDVQWTLRSAFRIGPFNSSSAGRTGDHASQYVSDTQAGNCFFVPYENSSTHFGFTSAAAGEVATTIDLAPYTRFLITVDALTGIPSVQEMP